jgi:cobalt-zinc-cadmium efflux system membrane fusion protein
MDSLALGRLRSSYLQAKTRLDLARQNHERERRLFKEQISSAKEKLHTETALQEARITLKAAQDQLRLIGVSHRDIQRLEGNTMARDGRMTLRAPREGRVVAKHVVPGERLTPQEAVLTIADLSVVWVWASVYERDLAPLLRSQAGGGLKAEVVVAAFPKIRIVVPNDDALLRPGMFAEATVALDRTGRAHYVPADAVVGDGDDRFVFVKIGSELFLRRDVRTGEKLDGSIEILSGLKDGEEIVVRGAFLLKSDILRGKMGAGCAD